MTDTDLILHMIEMGLLVSLVPPVFIVLTRKRLRYRGLSWPAPAAMLFFLALHAATVIGMSEWEPPPVLHGLLHVVLVTGAVIFWLPVLGYRRRLSDPMRCVYLFLACPTLDLPAVWVVGWVQGPAGLAMIVAMLPIGVFAVALTWRWITAEERAVRFAQEQELVGAEGR
jgi:cytochrome c oxidase assembly factor CtaG